MKFNIKFSIAIHTLVMITYFSDTRVTSKMIAKSVGTNPVVIRNLYRDLKEANLLTVKRGAGTTKLMKSANETTLWDIYKVVESIDIEEIINFPDNPSENCPIGNHLQSSLFPHLEETLLKVKTTLSNVTIADLVKDIEKKSEKNIKNVDDFPFLNNIKV